MRGHLLFLGLLIGLLPSAAFADTRYVKEELVITMRAGKGSDFEAVKYINSGTQVEALEEDGDYMRVVTQDGTEGWVLKKYLTQELPKDAVIAELRSKTARLQDRMEAMKKERAALEEQLKSGEKSKQESTRAAKSLKEITGRYDTLLEQSKNVVALVEDNERLKAENRTLKVADNQLKADNERLRQRQAVNWFLAGGGVFFFGWIIGKISRKKRRY